MMTLTLLSALALGAPATVLSHTIDATVDSRKSLKETVTWTVRIDDPAACAAGVLAPPGLDGAMDGGAMVLEDLLVVPPDTAAGAEFTLSATTKGGRGSHSSSHTSAPDLPVQEMRITVTAPGWVPLTVWADPLATPLYEVSRRTRKVTMSWTDVEPGETARSVWSTWPDWAEAGSSIEATVNSNVADKAALGRDLASGLEGLGLAGIVERAWQAVELDPVPSSWSNTRRATAIANDGLGNPAERALVLLSMLRVAGFDAHPGYFRPSTARGEFAVTVPAPTLMPSPMVEVRRKGSVVYIDPAAEQATVPQTPSSMLGSVIWQPGDLPRRLADSGLTDGSVSIVGEVTIDGSGDAAWSIALSSEGSATERLRTLLGPLDEVGRADAIKKLLKVARPEVARLQVTVTGVENLSKPLRITANGFDEGALQALDYGLRGTVDAILAPALAAWLPPNLQISEQISIAPPATVNLLALAVPEGGYRSEALVQRRSTRQADKTTLETSAQRPYRVTSPAVDVAATEFLHDHANRGAELLFSAPASGPVVKAMKADSSISGPDRVALEALLWWRAANLKKGGKAIKKGVASEGFGPVLKAIERFVSDNPDAWEVLVEYAPTDLEKVQVANAMARVGLRREGWAVASDLRESEDLEARGRALLTMERLQPQEKPPESDQGASAAWVEPTELLSSAEEALGASDKELVFRKAQVALEAGDAPGAEALLAEIAGKDDPLATALLALAAAKSGVAVDEVIASARAAVDGAPEDPAVAAAVAKAMASVRAWKEALRYAIDAARLADNDPTLWSEASTAALAAGDLSAALYAAEQASSAAPKDQGLASKWMNLALLAKDTKQLGKAASRAGVAIPSVPSSFDDLMSAAPPEALYALLQYADQAVSDEARLLSMRGQMRIENNDLDGAARDGLVLVGRYGWKEGAALAFGATAGRQYSTAIKAALDDAAKSQLTALTTRMEYRLVAGDADPLRDARALDDDPRAEALLAFASKPAENQPEGWPEDVPEPTGTTPKGFRTNRALQSPGVTAYSDPEAAIAILRVGTVTGLLPAPLAHLYTPNEQVLERLDNGGQLIRLDGGVSPLYAATVVHDGQEVYGIAFTRESAKLALKRAL